MANEEIPLQSINIVFRDEQIERYWDDGVGPEDLLEAAKLLIGDALEIFTGEEGENGDE